MLLNNKDQMVNSAYILIIKYFAIFVMSIPIVTYL